MTYIKLLTAPLIIIAGLALLTACGGGAAPTGTIADPCVGNPFATGCTTSTDAQKLAFCRDTNQTTNTKTNDCGPVVSDICTPNPFDTICTDHATAQENFCGDPARTTPTKDADCAPVVMRVCRENVRNLILCTAPEYVQERMRLDNACLVRTGSQAVCDEEVRVATCDADPFPTNCVEQKYIMGRQSACLMDLEADDTCSGPAGLATIFCRANPFDDALACRDPVYLPFRTDYCERNGDVAACPNINYGKWRDSFKGDDELATAPANLNERVDIGFLSGLTTTAPVITGLSNSLYSPLTFADFNGGDGRGGSVYWLGTWTGTDLTNFHAGILTTTDVGAPLTSDLGGSWVGRFQAYNTAVSDRVDVDFTLTVNFTEETIHAFLENVVAGEFGVEVDFEIDGGFDPETGVIDGTIEYGRDDGLANNDDDNVAPNGALEEGDRSYLKGTLTGLIGQHGATGAFFARAGTVYMTGAFIAVPKNLIVNHADWVVGLGEPAAGAMSIITETITDHDDNRIITFTTPSSLKGTKVVATFDDQPFSENLLGGFYRHFAAGVHSVGLLERTNVGAPLGDTFSGGVMTTATWNGMIQGNHVGNTDFSLEIDLSDDSVVAFYQTDDPSNYYHFEGSYTATGLLTGTVNYGEFTSPALRRTTPTRDNNGIFRGIIGRNGATAVFVSGAGVSGGQATGDGRGEFSGGFVVSPTVQLNPNANFSDWVRDFGFSPPPATLTAGKNQFLAGGPTGLSDLFSTSVENDAKITLTLGSAVFNGAQLLETRDARDGVAFFYDTIETMDEDDSYNYYAGILSGTDLGAPIKGTAATTAKWEGQLIAFRDTGSGLNVVPDNRDLILDITFAGDTGKIESYINIFSGTYYHVDGTYNAQGVISGSVDFGTFTGVGTETITPNSGNSEGILTGLIGEQGAVGAFIGGTGEKEALVAVTAGSGKIAYVGGFVAAPYVEPRDTTPTVTLNDWTRSFRRYPPPATIADATVSMSTLSAFLSIPSAGTLDEAGLTTEVSGVGEEPDVVFLTRAGSDMDGVAYVSGFDDTLTSQLGFVGLLSTTDLGAIIPIPTGNDTTAMWAGSYYNSGNGAVVSSPVTFAIDFSAARTIDGTGTGTTTPVFDLTFDARGVISGTVVSDGQVPSLMGLEQEPAKVFAGTARGLIGEQGLVGGFISPTGHHGGFVADNPAFDDTPAVVSYLDWVDITTPDTTRDTPLTNQFLTGVDGVSTPTNGTVGFVTLENATNGGTAFGGDSNDGLQLYSNDISTGADPTNFYTGILTTTNLGAPLTMQTAEGTWQGRLYAARDTIPATVGGTVVNTEVADFTPTVNFGTKTISANITGVTKLRGVDIPANTVSYDFTAVWDERGVFEGTINRNLSTVASAGVLTGLIGADGAVGVFISDAGAGVGYAGGFVARKAPSE